MMGALQFTVPGSLTNQHRDTAGKVIKLLGNVPGVTTSQAHENSVSFEKSQQDAFVAFHALIVTRLEEISNRPLAVSAESTDFTSQLRELKSLLDDGILSQEEFESAKQAILRKI